MWRLEAGAEGCSSGALLSKNPSTSIKAIGENNIRSADTQECGQSETNAGGTYRTFIWQCSDFVADESGILHVLFFKAVNNIMHNRARHCEGSPIPEVE